MAPTALATTILALTLAISIGRSLGIRSGQRIDSNQEFIGQGISNIGGAFFSAFPSAGSFNRSGANYEAGAKTPLANVYASLFLVAIVLVVAPLAAYLPLASVAAILLPDRLWTHRRQTHEVHRPHEPLARSAVMFVTLGAALFLGLQTAIYAGVLLSLMLFLNQAARPGIRDVKPDFRRRRPAFRCRYRAAGLSAAERCCGSTARFSSARRTRGRGVSSRRPRKPATEALADRGERRQHRRYFRSGGTGARSGGRRTAGGGLYFYFMKDAVRQSSTRRLSEHHRRRTFLAENRCNRVDLSRARPGNLSPVHSANFSAVPSQFAEW